jgi:hypothetical protein
MDTQTKILDRQTCFVLRLAEAGVEFGTRDAERNLTAARIAEAFGAKRNVRGIGSPFDEPMIDWATIGITKVEGHGPAAPAGRSGTIDARQRRPVGVMQLTEPVEQPTREAFDAFVNRVDPERRDELKAERDRRQRQIVRRTVFETGFPFRQIEFIRLYRRDRDRSPGEPWPSQFGERRLARDQTADPGRVAEDLVEGLGDEIRSPSAKVQVICRGERGGVEQDVPAMLLRERNPV